jgi:predicted permease
MGTQLGIIIPFFAIVALGFFAVRRRVLPEGGINGLIAFCFYFALPAMLFDGVRSAPLSELLDARISLAYLLGGLALLPVAALTCRWVFQVRSSDAVFFGFGAVHGNVGFMGLPMMVALFGDAALAPAAIVVLVDLLVIYTIVFVAADLLGDRPHGLSALVRTVGGSLVRNPFLIAIALGVAAGGFGVALPSAVERVVKLLAQSAAPTALFALGASLAMHGMGRGQPGPLVFFMVTKLAIHPLLIWLIATHLIPLSPLQLKVAVAQAALPIAVNLFLLGSRYVKDVGTLSEAVLLTTAAGPVSLAFWLWLVGA